MIALLINLLILVLILSVFYWLISTAPIPAPFAWIVRLIFGIIFIVGVLGIFYGGFGIGPHPLLR